MKTKIDYTKCKNPYCDRITYTGSRQVKYCKACRYMGNRVYSHIYNRLNFKFKKKLRGLKDSQKPQIVK